MRLSVYFAGHQRIIPVWPFHLTNTRKLQLSCYNVMLSAQFVSASDKELVKLKNFKDLGV